MAKAKKSEESGAEEKKAAPTKKAAAVKPAEASAPKAAAAKPAAAKAPAAKKPAKPASAGTGGFGFGIDTNLAAQNAARMLLNRSASAPSTSAGGGTAKHLKDSLGKPQNAGLGNLLGPNVSGGAKSSNQSHFSNQQKGQNQATGHVGNTGVPRRTPG